LNTGRNYNEEIRAALRGQAPTHVPFTIYPGMLPRGRTERELRERGLAFCWRVTPFRRLMPDVKVSVVHERAGGVEARRTVYETPVGTVSELSRPGAYGTWRLVEHRIKRLDDYRVAEFMARNTRYEPAYEEFLLAREQMGADGYVLGSSQYSPLLEIQVCLLGIERFCVELLDHEAEVLSLYEALRESQRRMYRVVARSPVEACLYGGNIMQETLGPERIELYVAPCWQEFAELMHEEGKLLGVHLDANNSLLLGPVARSPLDFIEAFTPPPDCDTSVAEARAAWPGKALWLNFPSSAHLREPDRIRQLTRALIAEAGDRRGFLLGVTEDVPRQVLLRSLSAILDVVESTPLAPA